MFPKFLTDILLGKLLGKCDCPTCSQNTVTRKVLLSGAALAAAIEGFAESKAQVEALKKLLAEMEATKRRMWATIQKDTGTEGIDDLSLNLNNIDIGIAVLKIPVKGETTEAGGAEPSNADSDNGNLEEAFRDAPDPVSVAA